MAESVTTVDQLTKGVAFKFPETEFLIEVEQIIKTTGKHMGMIVNGKFASDGRPFSKRFVHPEFEVVVVVTPERV